jgi:hypothetical protein
MEDVAGKMLGDFAKRLQSEVLRGSAPTNGNGAPAAAASVSEPPSASGPASPPPPAEEPPAALDLGSVVAGPLAKRAAMALGAVALLLVVRSLVRGSKRGLSVNVNWR